MSALNTLPGIETVWLDTPEALRPLRQEWQDLADRTGADVYLMPDWIAVWWQHFGAGRRLACLVVRREGALVGVLPFCLETIWAGPVPIRIARLAGTDPYCIVFTLPVEHAIAPAVLQDACRHLLGPGGCHAISLTPVSDRADFLPWVRQIAEDPAGLALTERPGGSHVIFALPDSFDTYLATRLSKNRRAQFRRDLKALESRFAMQTTTSVPDAAAFDQFVTFHNQQWQAIGLGGHFADWPGSAVFYRDMAKVSVPGRGVGLYSETGNTGPLATQFGLIGGQTCHWRLPARTLDAEAERLSIGKVGLLLMIEKLIKAGVRRIEAGRGEYDYKLAYGGEDIPVHRLLISPSTPMARRRVWLLLAWSDMFDILHYRIWFKRIAPGLRKLTGAPSRPLWRSWIRSRI